MNGWVYILKLNNDRYYIGSTSNIENRIIDHQSGKSTYTSKFLPVKLLFKHEYHTYAEAKNVEMKLKKMKSKKIIDKIVKNQKLNIKIS